MCSVITADIRYSAYMGPTVIRSVFSWPYSLIIQAGHRDCEHSSFCFYQKRIDFSLLIEAKWALVFIYSSVCTVGVHRHNYKCYRRKQQYEQWYSSQCSRDVKVSIWVSLYGGNHIKQLVKVLLLRVILEIVSCLQFPLNSLSSKKLA